MFVEIVTTAFDPLARLHTYQTQSPVLQGGNCGAVTIFIGNMRDYNAGDNVTGLFLEHYSGMAERYLQELCATALQQWNILDALVIHRVGMIVPTDCIVLVAVWSGHRAEAFAACRFLIEELKHHAPFWKQETLFDGSTRWVTQNTPAG